MSFAQARWNEPTIFERSSSGKAGIMAQERNPTLQLQRVIPERLARTRPPRLPEVTEIEVVRHFTRLSQQNYGVDLGFHPLGSCTMKYNPKAAEAVVASQKLRGVHPYQDPSTVQGILKILYELSGMLAEIVGMHEVSLQPSAGAHAEYAGTLIIRARHKKLGILDRKTEIIVPDSAHGTNPASAAMAGFKVVEVPSDRNGCVDLDALKRVVSQRTAGLMITNPNTLGLFETNILEIAKVIHDVDGLLYYDGANLNAILGKAKPGDMGFDIVHINIHKTFSTPHGGGGPGAGPLGVTKTLAPFLPVPTIAYDGKKYYLGYDRPDSIGKLRSFYGNVAVLVRAYAYILMLGEEGLRRIAELSVLNANYLARKASGVKGFNLPLAEGIPRKHECVISASKLAHETSVTALDVAKRLLDFGVHAPTVYFPQIISESLMIEPTETVSLQELDHFISCLERISNEAYQTKERVLESPAATTVRRVDEAKASRPSTMCLTWRQAEKLGLKRTTLEP